MFHKTVFSRTNSGPGSVSKTFVVVEGPSLPCSSLAFLILQLCGSMARSSLLRSHASFNVITIILASTNTMTRAPPVRASGARKLMSVGAGYRTNATAFTNEDYNGVVKGTASWHGSKQTQIQPSNISGHQKRSLSKEDPRHHLQTIHGHTLQADSAIPCPTTNQHNTRPSSSNILQILCEDEIDSLLLYEVFF